MNADVVPDITALDQEGSGMYCIPFKMIRISLEAFVVVVEVVDEELDVVTCTEDEGALGAQEPELDEEEEGGHC